MCAHMTLPIHVSFFEMREVGKQSKVYAFECTDNLETKRWVRVIDAIKRRTLSERAKKEDIDIRAGVPNYILIYSDHGASGCSSIMRENLNHLFPEIAGCFSSGSPGLPGANGNDDSSPRPVSNVICEAITGEMYYLVFWTRA